MDNLLYSKLYSKILATLTEPNYLKRFNIEESFIVRHVESVAFLARLESLIENEDFSCDGTLNLCKDILDELGGDDSPDSWLEYIYQFALNNSFPHAVRINFHENLNKGAIIYLSILRIFSSIERNTEDFRNQVKYPLTFLTGKEEKDYNASNEYRKFKRVFYRDYIYEMMKLHRAVTGHNTIDHISGVHLVAMHVGKQLYNTGLPVDLGWVSGAAAGHDIGKFGCVGKELKRVPYFHYYYTELWFKKHKMTYIGHIAANHSTWDLELENLPIESLILIYSDFRVKNRVTENNKKDMYIYSLEDSFNIVLDKLDNLDEAKEKRYRRVYAKLRDFENYMISLGINVDPFTEVSPPVETNYYPLMQNQQVIEHLKYLSISHNIDLMDKLRNEASLSSILELARSENDWKNLRAYLTIFEEYSTYLTQKQKLITLNFLYELLIHKEEDVRKQAADLIGILIATFDEEYRKEIPEGAKRESIEITSFDLLDKYIHLFLFPDHKILEAHREWIGYNLRGMISSLCNRCSSEKRKKYRDVLLKYYEEAIDGEKNIQFYLIQTVKYVPYINLDDKISQKLFAFMLKMLRHDDVDIRLAALDRIYNLLYRINKNNSLVRKLIDMFKGDVYYSKVAAENFLRLKIATKLNLNDNILKQYRQFFEEDNKNTSDIFLKNLKSATNWVSKKIHIELLLEQVIKNPKKQGLHTAMHFCNLIKVSAVENVRNHAGDALLKIFPMLPMDQRNDVTVELLRALEIQGYHFTKYIPNYLGQLILYLQPVELDELIDDFIDKMKHSNTQINLLLLKTTGVALKNYPKYKSFFSELEDENAYKERQIRMLGILLNGLVHFDTQVKQEAFRIIGKEIFGSFELNLYEKRDVFHLIAKKILTLLPKKEENELLFLNDAASLNHIYRFISDYVFFEDDLSLDTVKKIAFFPGTFDPFSLSHKEIAKAIRDKGFEVYLAVDEFSWSKRTQPHKLRRRIISMSIANELNIYLYPQDLQINIANPTDLTALRDNFPNSKVHIVVGSDVIVNASSYKADKSENSIHDFPHIIFERKSSFYSTEDDIDFENALKRINRDSIVLTLPLQYEDISSTQIRNYIDENRDISQLIDPLAQNFIYEFGLYRREPQYKSLIQTKSINIEIYDDVDDYIIKELYDNFFEGNERAIEKFKELKTKLSPRVLIIRDIHDTNKILAFSAFHWVRSSMLFNQFKDNNVSEFVRENAVGRIIVIDGIFTNSSPRPKDLEQITLTETLAFCLAKDYTYAIFNDFFQEGTSSSLHETLKLQGFEQLPYGDESDSIFSVSMTNPCTLNLDIETVIKEPFRSNENVQKALLRSRKRLQKSLTKLYPGQLIISFDRDILYEKLVEKICDVNKVSTEQTFPRKLGNKMCVPFGSILSGYTIPNTVTKSMHTEKMFEPDIKSFDIGPFPNYMNLENQIKMLKSFGKPVILVDDLLNKGYRIKAIDPIIKNEDLKVEKIIVGILSGRGKELMDIQGRDVDSAYFIPNLKVWFNENSLYPFIGGDTVWRGYFPERNLLSSINFVLPYASPTFIKNTKNDSVYELSETCLRNSLEIISTLEKEYRMIHERNLTLKHLGDVFTTPRCPDHGKSIDYDLNLKPTQYLKNDLEHLKRIEDIIRR
ncbi:MAG: cytidyltransferase [Firmicutes bacterium]|nr:cytidyltransferase [Bacillota bacterium]